MLAKLRFVHTLAFAYDRVFAISYDERTKWHAGTTWEVTLELYSTRVRVLRYL